MLHHLLSLFFISQPVGKYDELVAPKIPDGAVNSSEISCLHKAGLRDTLVIENHKLESMTYGHMAKITLLISNVRSHGFLLIMHTHTRHIRISIYIILCIYIYIHIILHNYIIYIWLQYYPSHTLPSNLPVFGVQRLLPAFLQRLKVLVPAEMEIWVFPSMGKSPVAGWFNSWKSNEHVVYMV